VLEFIDAHVGDFLNSTFECETGVVEEDGGVTKAFEY
jgi:hypothetical protein